MEKEPKQIEIGYSNVLLIYTCDTQKYHIVKYPEFNRCRSGAWLESFEADNDEQAKKIAINYVENNLLKK